MSVHRRNTHLHPVYTADLWLERVYDLKVFPTFILYFNKRNKNEDPSHSPPNRADNRR